MIKKKTLDNQSQNGVKAAAKRRNEAVGGIIPRLKVSFIQAFTEETFRKLNSAQTGGNFLFPHADA